MKSAGTDLALYKLGDAGYPGTAKFAGLAWSAYSHSANISKFNAALAAADQCALVTANADGVSAIGDMAVAANTATDGIIETIKSGRQAPNPDINYTAAVAGTNSKSKLSSLMNAG